MEYDLIISGGTIIDGTGEKARAGDIAIRDGKIVALGEVKGKAKQQIDATGQIVCPGFIDIHTHYDAQILWDPMLTISPWHGVTTVVMGNCGFGVAPTRVAHRDLILRTLEKVEGMSIKSLREGVGSDWGFESFPQYLDLLESRGKVINVGAFVGHTPVRTFVMGEEAVRREATAAEIETMQNIVREAMAAGALGFSSSRAPTHMGYDGHPVPSRLASMEEFLLLVEAMGDKGKGLVQSTLGADLIGDPVAEVARRSGRPFTWTALLAGTWGPGGSRRVLEETAGYQADGYEVRPQVSCRPLCFEIDLNTPFLFEGFDCFAAANQADREGKKQIYQDQTFREKLKSQRGFGAAWDRTTISYLPSDPSLEEKSLQEIAEQRNCHPVDVMLDLSVENDLRARFRMAVANTDEDELEELLQSPVVVLGLSDAGAHASQLCDAGFSTHLLGYWVREKNALTMEGAIRMLTSQVADLLSIRDRGRLANGMAADIVVFDPDTVECAALRRVQDLPAGEGRLVADSVGISSVIVNGVEIRRAGENCVASAQTLPGQLIRSC